MSKYIRYEPTDFAVVVKLNTMPMSKDWNGILVLVPPFAEDEPIEAEE